MTLTRMETISPIGTFNDKKNVVKKRIQFRPLKDHGFQEMGNRLENFDWGNVLSIASADKQMEMFQKELFNMFDESFPEKTIAFLNDSQPFYNEKLLLLKKKKKREYSRHRRSEKYLSLSNSYKEELLKSKRRFYRDKVRTLKKSNPRQWHKVLKKLITSDVPDEKVEVEAIKHLSDSEQVEEIANKFARVANLYEPLDRNKITIPSFTSDDIPRVSCTEVKEILENMNVNKSCTVVQSKTRRLFVSAITPILLTLRLKVRVVLKNSENSRSDRHQDFPIWAKGS